MTLTDEDWRKHARQEIERYGTKEQLERFDRENPPNRYHLPDCSRYRGGACNCVPKPRKIPRMGIAFAIMLILAIIIGLLLRA